MLSQSYLISLCSFRIEDPYNASLPDYYHPTDKSYAIALYYLISLALHVKHLSLFYAVDFF